MRSAIIGATGQTGRNILQLLSSTTEDQTNVYVRSEEKLYSLFPDLRGDANTTVFEGQLDNISLLVACFKDVSTIFAATGNNENVPGQRVAQETAHAIVAALCTMRSQDPTARVPLVIFLSASTINSVISGKELRIIHWIIETAFWHVYQDLRYAEEFLRQHERWLNVTFIQPGGLVEDVPRGHTLSLSDCSPMLSYADLAAGMVEVAETGGYEGKSVAVMAKEGGVKFPVSLLWHVPKSMAFTAVPGLYWVARRVGLA